MKGINYLKEDIKKYWKGLLLVILFLVLLQMTHLHFCPFMRVLHIPCAGCGMTRAGMYLLTLQLKEAWRMNAMIYPFAALVVYAIICRYGFGKKIKWASFLITLLAIMAIAYYIYRWMTGFPPEIYS